MYTSLTVANPDSITLLPGTDAAPVFVSFNNDTLQSGLSLFLTEPQADELAQLLWNRKVKREEVA